MDGDAGRERPARCHDLLEAQPVATDSEHRDRVAAGVGRQEQMVLVVVDKRALRGERVGDSTGGSTTVSASRVGRRVRQRAALVLRIGGDRVAVGVIGLDKNGMMAALVGGRQHRWGAQQRGRHRGDDGRQSNQISHFSSSGQWFGHVGEG